MALTGKKHYAKRVIRAGGVGRLQRDNFIPEHSLMKKGSTMRKQINLYWKKRAEDNKRRLNRAT